MIALLHILTALVVVAGDPAPAAAPPADEALVDRFMTVIPDADQLDRTDRTADPTELSRLVQLNPGREADIRPVLEAFAACESPISRAIGREGLRFVARRLGSEKLERLIRFYEGEDFRRFEALAPRLGGSAPLSPEDEAELDRLIAAYPLAAFNTLVRDELPGFLASRTEEMAAIGRCTDAKEAALARLEIETESPLVTPVPPPNPVPNPGQ